MQEMRYIERTGYEDSCKVTQPPCSACFRTRPSSLWHTTKFAMYEMPNIFAFHELDEFNVDVDAN